MLGVTAPSHRIQSAAPVHSGWSRTFLRRLVHSTLQVPNGDFVLLPEDVGMELDQDKIDGVVLALLYLGLSNPQSKAKSVVFMEEGLKRAQKLLEVLFGKRT